MTRATGSLNTITVRHGGEQTSDAGSHAGGFKFSVDNLADAVAIPLAVRPSQTKVADQFNTVDRYGNTVQFNHPFGA